MTSRALITGISGQDGWYLSQWLLDKGYEVHGTVRAAGSASAEQFREALADRVTLHAVDLLDASAVVRLIEQSRPQELYNLAAPSFLPAYWQHPIESAELTALGPVRLLEALRQIDTSIRFCQAGSREVFGSGDGLLNEQSAFRPETPYGAAKAYAHWMTASYRRQHGLFASNAILFNHESPRRGEQFVTRKITLAAARIKLGLQDKVVLGSLDSSRDWGFAGDTVQALWLMLQHQSPDDYVIAMGQRHRVGEVVELAFGRLGLDWRRHVEIDPALAHAEAAGVCGDSSKARRVLGWRPEVGFEKLITMMVEADLQRLSSTN